MIMLYFSM